MGEERRGRRGEKRIEREKLRRGEEKRMGVKRRRQGKRG